MFDLMMGGIGGVVGAVLGPVYSKHSRRSRTIVESFNELIETRSGCTLVMPQQRRCRSTRP